MILDPTMLGHETQPEIATITAEDVRQFADAIADPNAIYRDTAAAQGAGFAGIPTPPTFATRFRIAFEDAGLDVNRFQVLHAEQEYTFTRPLVVGERIAARHRIASLRQTQRGGNMAMMSIEQLVDDLEGAPIVQGKAVVIVREAPPPGATENAGAAAKARTQTANGPELPPLQRHVTQEQINAYAEASGDHNPIHLDPEVARTVGLDGTIAHGMLSMAFAGQFVTDWLTTASPQGGWVEHLSVRFQAMVRPGETVTCHGILQDRSGERQDFKLWMTNERDEQVVSGRAAVILR